MLTVTRVSSLEINSFSVENSSAMMYLTNTDTWRMCGWIMTLTALYLLLCLFSLLCFSLQAFLVRYRRGRGLRWGGNMRRWEVEVILSRWYILTSDRQWSSWQVSALLVPTFSWHDSPSDSDRLVERLELFRRTTRLRRILLRCRDLVLLNATEGNRKTKVREREERWLLDVSCSPALTCC